MPFLSNLFFILAIILNTVLNFDDQALDVLKIASQVFLMLGLFCIGIVMSQE